MEKTFSYPMNCPDKEVIREHSSLVCTRDRCEHDKECKYKSVHSAEPLVKAKSDLDLCREYRKSLNLNTDRDITIFQCIDHWNNGLPCWEKCPVPKRMKTESPKRGGIYGMRSLMDFPEGDEKGKKLSREVEKFLDLQLRVLNKLAWHPEIYRLLDKLSSQEIIDRLGREPKNVVDEILPQHGGTMQVKPSDETKKMFANLEKQFASEDEKTGKKPYDFGEGSEPHARATTWEDWQPSFPRDLPRGYRKALKGDKEKLKLCQEHRQKMDRSGDFRHIECDVCLTFQDCPIWWKGSPMWKGENDGKIKE